MPPRLPEITGVYFINCYNRPEFRKLKLSPGCQYLNEILIQACWFNANQTYMKQQWLCEYAGLKKGTVSPYVKALITAGLWKPWWVGSNPDIGKRPAGYIYNPHYFWMGKENLRSDAKTEWTKGDGIMHTSNGKTDVAKKQFLQKLGL